MPRAEGPQESGRDVQRRRNEETPVFREAKGYAAGLVPGKLEPPWGFLALLPTSFSAWGKEAALETSQAEAPGPCGRLAFGDPVPRPAQKSLKEKPRAFPAPPPPRRPIAQLSLAYPPPLLLWLPLSEKKSPLRAGLNYAKGRGGETDVIPHHPGKQAMGVPSNPWQSGGWVTPQKLPPPDSSQVPGPTLALTHHPQQPQDYPATARKVSLSADELGLPDPRGEECAPLPSWRHPQKHSAILVFVLEREAGLGLEPGSPATIVQICTFVLYSQNNYRTRILGPGREARQVSLRHLRSSLPAVRRPSQRGSGAKDVFGTAPRWKRPGCGGCGEQRNAPKAPAAQPLRTAQPSRKGRAVSRETPTTSSPRPPAALRPPPASLAALLSRRPRPGSASRAPRLASPRAPLLPHPPARSPTRGTPAAHAVPPRPRRRAPRQQQPPPPAQQQQQEQEQEPPLAARLGARPPPGGMESQCDYFMYFPAVPFPAREVLLGEPGRYRALPRRNHLYLGETVRFLLVLRCRSGAGGAPRPPWGEVAGSLSALASVSPAGGGVGGGVGVGDEALLGEAAEEGAAAAGEAAANGSVFRECRALLTHGHGTPGTTAVAVPPEEPIVSTDEVIFPLTITLDRLPPSTVKAKIVATVWRRDQERGEVRERGYLSILQDRAPSQIFREEQGAFKAQVSTMLTVLPPPELKCQQLNVSGKHLTVLKVLNAASQDELSVWDVRILPNLNASYLPMMPDGSVLLVDDICHQSGEVSMASFCQVPSATSAWPCSLRALEEQNFLFQLQAPEQPPDSTKEVRFCLPPPGSGTPSLPGSLQRRAGGRGQLLILPWHLQGLEVPLIAVVQWSTLKLPFTSSIYTHYRLPSIRLARPRFVMTAECESPVVLHRRFVVTYTLINNLQDFLAVRLVWTPESAAAGKKPNVCDECRATPDPQDSIVCQTPLNNLGFSRKGSARTFCVTFQALRAGLFELSQHMKLKLQFTASVSNPPPEARPVSRKSSPGSPAVRELVGRHQASLGRSQSFSHQQPARGHLLRSGSVMERRAITPPVGSPVGRPLYLPPDKAALSLDKIAKRECKVLVLAPIT
ncbi:putative protein C7orf43 like [Crotalus adamanteus]|uniref:Microtubule associated protein 11 n=1 Tax=Crotalus adamanteus TaxID=8729 RepID=A0AAW1B9Q9_CROAD